MTVSTTKKKVKKSIAKWQVHIHASYNNTIVTIAENNWNTLAWATAGSCWFKGSRKATPYAWQVAAEKAIEKVKGFWFTEATVYIKWVWPWREQAVRGLISSWIEIVWLIDVTPVAHNGTRKRWVRKV